MALTPLPDPPQTSDPANFATKADALVAALAVMVDEINAAGGVNVGNATTLLGATWASPGNIGTGTPGTGAFTSLSVTKQATIGATAVTPFSPDRILRFGAGGSLSGRSDDDQVSLTSNVYTAASGDWTYLNTAATVRIFMNDGAVSIMTAPSGTAGTAATETERLSISNTGAVTISGTLALTATATPTGTGTGAVGQIAWDTSYLYICTATNDWRRAALTDF